MYRAFAFFCLLCAVAAAESQIELIAQSVSNENNRTVASGDVSIRSDGRYARADHLILCRDTGEAELFGNVYLADGDDNIMVGDYLWLKDTASKNALIDHFFTISGETNLWMSANEAKIEGNETVIRSGSVSACNPISPDWSIRFSSAKHDREAAWMDLYNPTFYAGRVPVFYMPYFGYHTDNKRHSGIVFPRFGSSNTEGTLYEQPVYLAPYDEWDLEVWEQWRTTRGRGETGVFRFVDSAHSEGTISVGQFKNNAQYIKDNQLERDKLQGGFINYERTRLFTKPTSNFQEGLTLEYQDYNDIEFVRLRSVDPAVRRSDIESLVTNKADYFFKTDDAYAGVYARYFKDFKTPALNDTLVQIQPETHLHLFNRPLFLDNLLINADVHHRNYERTDGYTAQDFTASVPIGMHFSFFDDYLLLSALWQADHYQIDYSEHGVRSGTKDNQKYALTVSTLLAKPYERFFHTVNLGVTLSDSLYHHQKGFFDEEFYVSSENNEWDLRKTASFKLVQFLFANSGNVVVRHAALQPMFLDSNNTLLDLTNEITISAFGATLDNKLTYSHDHDAVTKSITSLGGKNGRFDYKFSHLYETDGEFVTRRYLNSGAGYAFNANSRIDATHSRDMFTNEDRGFSVALTHKRGCYQTTLSFEREITPYNIAGGSSDSKTSDIIFLRLILIPFGDIGQQIYSNERS